MTEREETKERPGLGGLGRTLVCALVVWCPQLPIMAQTPPEDEPKLFKNQKPHEKEKTMKLWEDAYLSSGGDLKAVLSYYLYHTKSGKHNRIFITDGLRKTFQEKAPKQERHLSQLLDGLANLYNGYHNLDDRTRLLDRLLPILSKSELQRRGVVITKEQWEELKKNARPLLMRNEGMDGMDDYDMDLETESEIDTTGENDEINPALTHGVMYQMAAMMEEEQVHGGLKREHAQQQAAPSRVQQPLYHPIGPSDATEGADGEEEGENGHDDDEDATRRKRRKLQ